VSYYRNCRAMYRLITWNGLLSPLGPLPLSSPPLLEFRFLERLFDCKATTSSSCYRSISSLSRCLPPTLLHSRNGTTSHATMFPCPSSALVRLGTNPRTIQSTPCLSAPKMMAPKSTPQSVPLVSQFRMD
jgi:hypothetical protein